MDSPKALSPMAFLAMTPYQLVCWMMWATVACLAAASHALVTTLGLLLISSRQNVQSRFVLDFGSEEGKAAVQRWYEVQGPRTRFTVLEYRKYLTGHEFIVARLDQNTLCRFDRRARDDPSEQATAPSEDSAHILCSFESEYRDLVENSEVLLSISFPNGEDLKLILAVCFGIQAHPHPTSHRLLSRSRYFVSWTIVTTVARHASKWEAATLSTRVRSKIAQNTFKRICKASGYSPQVNEITTQTWSETRLPGCPASHVDTPENQETKDFWELLEINLKPVYNLLDIHGFPRKLLLRTQLVQALARDVKPLVRTALFCTASTIAKDRIPNALVQYVFTSNMTSLSLERARLYFQPSWWNTNMRELVGVVCYRAVVAVAEHYEDKCDLQLNDDSRRPFWSNAWDVAWGGKSSELERLVWRPLHSHGLIKEGHTSGGLADSTYEQGRQLWTQNWGMFTDSRRRCCTIIVESLATALLKHVTDLGTEQLIFGETTKVSKIGNPPVQLLSCLLHRTHVELVERGAQRK